MLSRTALRSLQALSSRSSSPIQVSSLSTSSRVAASNLSELGQKHVAHGLSARLSQAVITSGKGAYVTLDDARGEYLDFTSGIGVTALGTCGVMIGHALLPRNDSNRLELKTIVPGHCHPKVSQAAADQCFDVVHAQVSSFLVTLVGSILSWTVMFDRLALHSTKSTSSWSRSCSP